MDAITSRKALTVLCFAFWAGPMDQAGAAPAQVDLRRLGNELTPMGALRAGNREGSIPAWTGGLDTAPATVDKGQAPADPFADERPLYTVDAANVDMYRDRLSAGQVALLTRYPSYRLLVYPSHRTAAYPAPEYAHIRAEAPRAALAEGGNGVVGVSRSSVPFPIPRSGLEAIWNHLFRWRGGSVQRTSDAIAVRDSGSFTPVRVEQTVAWAAAMERPEPNRLVYVLGMAVSPPSLAGQGLLAIDPIDQTHEPRMAWTYNPGQRRVLRAPSLGYDSPAGGADGLMTVDDVDGFNGAPDRYQWSLLGKREMLISYNNYRLISKKLRHTALIRPLHLNPEHLRYELHRVWVVEAQLKSGASHIYTRRVFYLDEDSWQIAHVDKYDSRGQLWRVQVGHAVQFYEAPAPGYAAETSYDLLSRRYLVTGLTNEAPPMRFGMRLDASFFTTDALRRLAR